MVMPPNPPASIRTKACPIALKDWLLWLIDTISPLTMFKPWVHFGSPVKSRRPVASENVAFPAVPRTLSSGLRITTLGSATRSWADLLVVVIVTRARSAVISIKLFVDLETDFTGWPDRLKTPESPASLGRKIRT